MIDWERLQQAARSQFCLGRFSAHDPEHWERVEKYGLYLARSTGADEDLVRLFAWLHDCQRRDEGSDPQHGERAAAFAGTLSWLNLEPARLQLLQDACRDHERGRTSSQPTIGTCWDADRLDLDRVGIAPKEEFFSTVVGRELARWLPYRRRERVGWEGP